MNILTGIKNLLEFLNNSWSLIIVVIGLILALWKKIESYIQLSTEEKISTAKKQVQEAILKLITEAELDYNQWCEAGEIKRSEVITQIYNNYPILSKVADQDELIEWIDELIDEALVTLRDIISTNEGD